MVIFHLHLTLGVSPQLECWNAGKVECWVKKLDYIPIKPTIPSFQSYFLQFEWKVGKYLTDQNMKGSGVLPSGA
jgi:hypothetical protein